ncbi:MAG: beta-lactamase family protein [Clostridia bacterium]|nr:beta-lactamase family protein [Clostridia bacterium]
MFEKLTSILESYIGIGVPGCDCTVAYQGDIVYRRRFGDAENAPFRYNIYSCSKPITCTAALQLYEKGLYRLDDALADYMPEFGDMTVGAGDDVRRAEHPIRIRDLFTMTAGFSYDLWSPALRKAREETAGRCPTRETMRYLAKEPLCFEPGEHWNYSLCHDVLAALVEVISGERFGTYVKRHIFDPVGMKESTFSLPDTELDTLAEQYRYDHENKSFVNCGKQIQGYKLGTEYESGGAGCISSVSDYILFLEAMRKGDILISRETTDLMAENKLTDSQIKSYWYNPVYGYGLGVRCPGPGAGPDSPVDFGWDGAANSYLAIDRTHAVTVFFAEHVLNAPNQGRGEVYPCALEELGLK